MKRKTLYFIGAILLVLVLAFIFSYSKTETNVDILAKAKKGNFEISITTTGELRAENSERIQGPFLRKIGLYRMKISELVPEGSIVDSGDFVASLDKTEISSRYDDVEDQVLKVQLQYDKMRLDTAIELRQLRDNLINLNYSLEESEITLEQSKYESPATIRQATINIKKSNRAYNQALENYDLKVERNEAKMQEVSINLSQQRKRLADIVDVMDEFTIYAPRSGMVIYHKDWGGAKRKVGSEFNTWNPTVATLPDMSTMISKTYVNEIDISKISVGQRVVVGIDAFPGKELEGSVIEVANVGEDLPSSDAKVFEVIVRISESDSILRPNMTSSNNIIANSFEDVIYIPLEAVHNNDTLTYVIKKDNGSDIKQIIEVGKSNENDIVVLQGIDVSDEVFLTIPVDVDNLDFVGEDIYVEIKKKREIAEKEAEERRALDKIKRKKDKERRKKDNGMDGMSKDQQKAIRKAMKKSGVSFKMGNVKVVRK